MKNLLIVIILSLLSSISYSGLIDPSNSDKQHISYAENFVYVGKIICLDPQTNKEKYFGSCVAISDRVLLTAAHVFIDKNDKYIVSINNKIILIDSFIPHKDFDISKQGFNDIAIININESIGLKWYPSLYTEKNESGKICSLAGYGATGNFLSGKTFSDGKRRAGSNKIDKVENNTLVCSPSLKSDKTQLEFLIFHGDSGGGLFIGNELAGIHSFVSRNDKNTHEYETESFHTRISDHVEWIDDYLK
jgi:hypothetical protein